MPTGDTTSPPKDPTCEPIPDVKLGEKELIAGSGFTPGDVKVTFFCPAGTIISEHIGTVDKDGNFNGSFTVALDKPVGAWVLCLTDSNGQKVDVPFNVIP